MKKRQRDELDSVSEDENKQTIEESIERKRKKKRKISIKGDTPNIDSALESAEKANERRARKHQKKDGKHKKRRRSGVSDAENEVGEIVKLTEEETPKKQKGRKKKKDGEKSSEKKRKDKKSSSKKKRRPVEGSGSENEIITDEGKTKAPVFELTSGGNSPNATPGSSADPTTVRHPRQTGVPSKSIEDETKGSATSLPSIDIMLKTTTSKRNAFLHSHAAMPLLQPQDLKALDEKTQARMIGASADLCERILYLVHDCVNTAKKWMQPGAEEDAVDLEESVVNDMARLKKVPLAKQYVEMTLWRRVTQLNRDHLLAASKLGFGKGFSKGGLKAQHHQGLLLHREDDPDAKFVSYREAYMKNVVERYSESLEKMREAENMDADSVQFLLRCLDAGASLFGNLKCMDE